ncbi:alanyl-tRNA editing protein, partial [Microvirga sp. Mcv34]|uniref:alanyl-tRNA editing protein n=1 Tax=Microvirga sp. Mcv34 TaxID=2926016 RepID=UPI0021C6C08B
MTATTLLFRDDAYATSCEARVLTTTPEGGIVLDRTVFYAQGGGQPGDVGTLVKANGERFAITNTVYGTDRSQIVHLVGTEAASRFEEGETVEVQLDWPRRLKRMRVHTALHLLSVVLPYPVTGGSIGE